MTSDRTILITGVTGNQGGAVARSLEGSGFGLRRSSVRPNGDTIISYSISTLLIRNLSDVFGENDPEGD